MNKMEEEAKLKVIDCKACHSDHAAVKLIDLNPPSCCASTERPVYIGDEEEASIHSRMDLIMSFRCTCLDAILCWEVTTGYTYTGFLLSVWRRGLL